MRINMSDQNNIVIKLFSSFEEIKLFFENQHERENKMGGNSA